MNCYYNMCCTTFTGRGVRQYKAIVTIYPGQWSRGYLFPRSPHPHSHFGPCSSIPLAVDRHPHPLYSFCAQVLSFPTTFAFLSGGTPTPWLLLAQEPLLCTTIAPHCLMAGYPAVFNHSLTPSRSPWLCSLPHSPLFLSLPFVFPFMLSIPFHSYAIPGPPGAYPRASLI